MIPRLQVKHLEKADGQQTRLPPRTRGQVKKRNTLSFLALRNDVEVKFFGRYILSPERRSTRRVHLAGSHVRSVKR